MRRSVMILGYLTIAAFVLAHSINTLIAEALIGPPADLTTTPTRPRSAAAPQVNLPKMAEELLSGGLFVLPKAETASFEQTSLGASIGGLQPTGSLGASKKVKLMGTVVTEGVVPFAVVEDLPTKRQTLYHLLETIPTVGVIIEVRTDAILLQQGDVRELLELNPGQTDLPGATKSAAATSQGAGGTLKRVLDQREVAQSMADLPKLLSEARVGPVYANGKIDGWKIEGITPKSFYDRIGLRAGDVLKSINGVEIRDPGMVLSLFQQVKDERSVNLDVLRDGKKTSMVFDIR